MQANAVPPPVMRHVFNWAFDAGASKGVVGQAKGGASTTASTKRSSPSASVVPDDIAVPPSSEVLEDASRSTRPRKGKGTFGSPSSSPSSSELSSGQMSKMVK